MAKYSKPVFVGKGGGGKNTLFTVFPSDDWSKKFDKNLERPLSKGTTIVHRVSIENGVNKK